MPRDVEDVASFRRDARQTYDEYYALLVLGHLVTDVVSDGVQETREFLATDPLERVEPFINQVRKEITNLRRDLKVTADRSALSRLVQVMESSTMDVQYVPKTVIDSMTEWNTPGSAWAKLPAHTRIGFTLRRPAAYQPELLLLEAKLYEDMCSLYNICLASLDARVGLLTSVPTVVQRKGQESLLRATFVAAFQFVEAYLNGIAADVLLTREDLEQGVFELLAEKPRFVAFRDKALQYPRIYAKSPAPLLQESNCAELALLTGEAMTRGAVAHPSTIDLGDKGETKEEALFKIDLDRVSSLVDAAVGYVRKVETAIGRESVLLEWILPRNLDGSFPMESFQ